MIRRVAVTGATGFLGRHLAAALAQRGIQIALLARRAVPPGTWPGIAPDIVSGDLEDLDSLDRLAARVDSVIHAAGLVAAPSRAAFWRANRDGAEAAAVAARRYGARFILVSSLAARSPHLSDYAASKRAGEDAVRAVYADAPEQLVILRPPVVYGPFDRATLAIFKAASRPVMPLFGSGRIAMLHAADAAATIVQFAASQSDGGLYALADANPGGYSMAELANEAARATGRHPRLVRLPDAALLAAGAVSGWWSRRRNRTAMLTTGKAREILHADWSVAQHELPPADMHHPRITLAEGFRDTVTWYRVAGWLR